MNKEEIRDYIINEMACANDCPEYNKSDYESARCTCYKLKVISEVFWALHQLETLQKHNNVKIQKNDHIAQERKKVEKCSRARSILNHVKDMDVGYFSSDFRDALAELDQVEVNIAQFEREKKDLLEVIEILYKTSGKMTREQFDRVHELVDPIWSAFKAPETKQCPHRSDIECFGDEECDGCLHVKESAVTGGQVCRVCGCTDEDCSQCIAVQGHPCYWVEEDLCSRCAEEGGE